MKAYYYQANRKQLEKPTEPLYVSCDAARCKVIAATEAEAAELAAKKLHERFDGTGVVLGQLVLTKSAELPIDWSYGYGDERRSGCTACIGDLVGANRIR